MCAIYVNGYKVAEMESRFQPESAVTLDGEPTPFQFASSGCRTVRMAEMLLLWAHGRGYNLCEVEDGEIVVEVSVVSMK